MTSLKRSPLHDAALTNRADEVRRLIAAGEPADVQDAQGFTPLHFAAQEGAVEAAKALLKAGAPVDARNTFGNSPLFTATFNSNGRGDMIKLLRSYGADPLQVNDSGQTPVGLARLIANYDVEQFYTDIPE
ncbi:ankyrin repeat domain-containing protein [Schaalia sp. JY-X169]|uniref:ankyrin repeat domain-containing protein n=1 Tax=Schaalia sp. JY-X169 TaxID=2758572 RepID=UPI0015F4DCF7|nr:ankyrin repeat domain-containing protein [Schaalia sp. JY-X169]MBP7881287.1 ankyrin repeat domain-containing protein [Actinomyces sp.]